MITHLYCDSIVIEKEYRKNGIGAKFSFYVFDQIPKLYFEYKRILANTVSEGGLRIAEKRGLYRVGKENDSLIIVEKVMKGKAYVRKKTYKNRDKHIIERKKVGKKQLILSEF